MVDYGFYKEKFLGSGIGEGDFPMLEARAREQLERYKRIYTVEAPDPDAENMAICAMAEAMAYFAAAQNGEMVASTSVGSVSVSYAGAAGVDLSPRGQARELYRCAGTYLHIHRGV